MLPRRQLVELEQGADAIRRVAIGKKEADFVPGEKLEPIYLRETTFQKAPAPRSIP